MNDRTDPRGTDERLMNLLDHYQTMRRQGRHLSVGELCPGEPGLASELQELIKTEEHIARLAGDDEVPDTVAPGNEVETLTPLPSRERTEEVPATDRYEVRAKLGEGGMGAVYRARDRVLDREVALKVIRPDVLTADLRQRFLVEAQAVARLDHPNIVKVFDVGEWSPPGEGPTPYLSLEFVSGGSLSKHLAQGAMELREASRVVRLLARAMAHAHSRGVVHRDLKPDNVLLAAQADEPSLNCGLGCPKVTDFGLARQQGSVQRLTRTGAVMGTPAYMAPEQAEGLEAGPPADVYALGVILYRLLTGKVPFAAPSAVEVMYQVIRETPPPPRQVRPEVPEELENICLACMDKKPAARPTAGELAARLELFLAGVSPSAMTMAPQQGNERVKSDAGTKGLTESPNATLQPRPNTEFGRKGVGVGWIVAAVVALVLLVPAGVVAVVLSLFMFSGPVSITGKEDANVISIKSGRARPLRVQAEDGGKTITKASLSGELMVKVWATDRGVKGWPIGVTEGAVPVRKGDQIQIEATLNEPAYGFLLLVDGQGSVTPLYPWNADELVVESVDAAAPLKKEAKFRNPPRLSSGWPLDDTPGLETVLLLARREPWPEGKKLSEVMGKVPAAPLREHGEVVVRGWNRGKVVEVGVQLDIKRGVEKQAKEIDDQLLRLVDRLSAEFEVIRAVRFAHVSKGK